MVSSSWILLYNTCAYLHAFQKVSSSAVFLLAPIAPLPERHITYMVYWTTGANQTKHRLLFYYITGICHGIIPLRILPLVCLVTCNFIITIAPGIIGNSYIYMSEGCYIQEWISVERSFQGKTRLGIRHR